jgi:hypothetical protein
MSYNETEASMSISQNTVEERKARMKALGDKARSDWQRVEDDHVAKIADVVLDGNTVSQGVIGKDSPTER